MARHIFGKENTRVTLPPAFKPERDYTADRANRPAVSLNDFDTGKQKRIIFKTVIQLLTNAGSLQLPLAGNCIAYFSSTNATDIVNVQWNPDSDPVPFHPGNYILNAPYGANEVTLSWTAQAGATAVFVITNVDPDNDLRIG